MNDKTVTITRSRLHELGKLIWAEAYEDGWRDSADQGGYSGKAGKAAEKSVREDFPHSMSSDYLDSLFSTPTEPTMTETHIGPKPPDSFYRAGMEIDLQCARCGSSMGYESCFECDDGYSHHDCGEDCCCCADPEPNVKCEMCDGQGGWHVCLSSPEWCEANPLPGREEIKRGQIEWTCSEERT